MDKYAVYSGTRNIYEDMETSAKSLVANSDVDTVFLLIEDEEFPSPLPDIIQPIDVTWMRRFWKGSPNSSTKYTYMALLRCCYSRIFGPWVEKILQLDCDTVVVDDVSSLWDIDMHTAWIMAADEPFSDNKPFGPRYANVGVMMLNLKQIRADRIEDKLIEYLRTTKRQYVEQDAWNKFANERTISLPMRYNECLPCGFTDDPAIIHFAAYKDYKENPRVQRREYLKKYRAMTWDEAMELHDAKKQI